MKDLIWLSDWKSAVLNANDFAIYYFKIEITVSAALYQEHPGGLKKTRIGGDRTICSMLFSLHLWDVAPE